MERFNFFVLISFEKWRCSDFSDLILLIGGMTRGLLGRNSPLHIRHNRRAALKVCISVVLSCL